VKGPDSKKGGQTLATNIDAGKGITMCKDSTEKLATKIVEKRGCEKKEERRWGGKRCTGTICLLIIVGICKRKGFLRNRGENVGEKQTHLGIMGGSSWKRGVRRS